MMPNSCFAIVRPPLWVSRRFYHSAARISKSAPGVVKDAKMCYTKLITYENLGVYPMSSSKNSKNWTFGTLKSRGWTESLVKELLPAP